MAIGGFLFIVVLEVEDPPSFDVVDLSKQVGYLDLFVCLQTRRTSSSIREIRSSKGCVYSQGLLHRVSFYQ